MKNIYKLSKKEEINSFNSKLKDIIMSSSFFQKLFDVFGVPLNKINTNLKFYIEDLKGKNAKSVDDDIYFDKSLFKNNDFLEKGIHYVVHEITHWLTRQTENSCYFNDAEERQAFALGMSYQLLNNVPKEEIDKIYLPIVAKHFCNEKNAKNFYDKLFAQAERLKEHFE